MGSYPLHINSRFDGPFVVFSANNDGESGDNNGENNTESIRGR